jgi:hypothetical protein
VTRRTRRTDLAAAVDGATTAVDAPADHDERAWRLGLVAVALLVMGTGWYQVFAVPPFSLIDEQAHVGYVLELQDGRLPTIDTPIDGADGGSALRERLAFTSDRYGEVWVANNPPIAYLAATPAATVTRLLDLPGGPLLGLRLTNLAFFTAAAIAVARLGRRLGGGDPTVGLLAAALFATIPYVGGMSGAGYVDGLALLCTVAMLDVLVAITRSGPTRRQIVVLAIWCALGVGVRPMTAVVAGAAVALALAVGLLRTWRRRADDDDDPTSSTPPAGVLWSAAVIALPTMVVASWYSVRNQRLYGDPTASERLFGKFGRTSRPLGEAWHTDVWVRPLRILLNRRSPLDEPSSLTWLFRLTLGLVVVLVLATVAVVVVDQVTARRRGAAPRTPALGWLAAVGLSLVVGAVAVQHWLGGGNIHARYLLFGAVVLAVAVALALVRLSARWVGVALVGGLIALQAHEVPLQNRTIRTQAWTATVSRALVDPIGPAPVRFLGVAVMALGLVALVVALVGLRRPTGPVDPTGPGPSGEPGQPAQSDRAAGSLAVG